MNGDAIALLLSPVAAGVLAGYAARGSLAGFLRFKLRALWLLWLAVLVQICELYGQALGPGWRLPTLGVTYALSGTWLGINLPGRPLAMKAAVGTALAGGLANGVAIAVNGRMPYLPAAARAAGVAPSAATPKNVPAAPGTHLIVLGDIVPVGLLHTVISVGDVLIILATVALIAATMRMQPRLPLAQPED